MSTEGLNLVRWAAWGVVNIEALDRQQRRNYLKKVHAELKPLDFVMHVGGTSDKPYYLVTKVGDPTKKIAAFQAPDAFSAACKQILIALGETGDGPVGDQLETVPE